MAQDDTRPEPGPGMLNGWKEIAAYLGKSVRSAQRWEHEFGLPTHRMKTPDAQIVYALKSEIDAWRRSLDPKAKKLEALDSVKAPVPVQSRWVLVGGAVLLAVLVIAALWVYRTVPNP